MKGQTLREEEHASYNWVIPVAAGITQKTVVAGNYEKKSSLFHITRQFYSFLGGCLTYSTIQLYFDGVQTSRMPK